MDHETREHFVLVVPSPPVYGERPEPWTRDYSCSCGADLGMDEEGRGEIDVQAAFTEHMEQEGLIDHEG